MIIELSENVIDAIADAVVKKMQDSKTCEDCISRQAVIRLVEQYPNIIGNRCSGLIADIKHLPSVTPQRQEGRWIATENEEMNIDGYFCSCCDLPMETEERTKYCPNCGAKMRGGGEDEDGKSL